MTTIDVHTSPLQAAREWRGIGMIAAARTAGLTSNQVEALESGDADEFNSIDEMVATAVLYGASLGIGRDEAMALLDRTVLGTGADVELPRAIPSFTDAVRERSARIADRGDVAVSAPLADDSLVLEPMTAFSPEADRSDEFGGPTPEQAVSASQEIDLSELQRHMDSPAPWEHADQTGELEAWAEDRESSFDGGVEMRPSRPARKIAVGDATFRVLERTVGTSRAESTMEWIGQTQDRVTELARTGRERLRKSEHATLIVAIGGGALLIALMVAIGGALGGSDEPKATPSKASTKAAAPAAAAGAETATPAATTPPAATPAKAAAALPPAKLTVNVYNAGSKKGVARTMSQRLKDAKYQIGTVGNDKGNYGSSTVIYGKGFDREAKALARRLGISTLQQAPGSMKRGEITVVIV